MKDNKQYFAQEIKNVLEELRTSEHGLSEAEAKERLTVDGFNELPEVKRDSSMAIFWRQFKSPLIYVLLLAGIVVVWRKEFADALVIFFVLLFNAVVGAIQEGKAQNTFLALKKFIKGSAIILRDGVEVIVSDRDIVLGDIIIIREGEKIPADARLIFSNALKINESALTGESIPRFKTVAAKHSTDEPEMIQENMVYKGTAVVSGSGKAVVTATAEDTFLGSIAKETLGIDPQFPLKNEIKKLSRLVIFFVIAVCVLLFFFGKARGYSGVEILETMIAMAVSVIPEGLPIVITLVLASGVWRMGKKNVLIKKLQAVEVLGEIKVLAVDKTGTVTKNELVMEEIYVGGDFFTITGDGYAPVGEVSLQEKIVDPLNHATLLLAGKIAALNSSANLIFEKSKKIWKVAGDPTEGAMSVFAKKIGFHADDLLSETPLLENIPFDYETKLHLSLHQQKDSNLLLVTGSPEVILDLCEKQKTNKSVENFLQKQKEEIKIVMQAMSRKGLRVIGFASCETKIQQIDKSNLPKFIFGGFFGIKDALREEVHAAVLQVQNFGIKVVMITGDHELTAKAIAREAGIYKSTDEIMTGTDIEKIDEDELKIRIKNVSVFARINPKQKLKIIKAYQANDTIIAMTGDGVNDALSLAMADIGIGMGNIGTEVAKEASDIILVNDDFGNIIYGVEEGRNIFRVIKKVVLYLFSTNLGEVIFILSALFLGFPLPILAVQILWLNLVTDGFLDMALAMDIKKQEKIGDYEKTSIMDKLTIQRMFLMAITMALGSLYLFSQNYQADIAKAWTISLTVLAVFQWFNVWNCRSDEKSVFSSNPLANKFLVGATIIIVVLQLLAVYNPFFQKMLQTVALSGKDWLVIIATAFTIVIVEEVRKIIMRIRKA